MDKATPTTSPASVDSVMALLSPCCAAYAKWQELGKRGRTAEEEDAALREMRDAQEAIRTELERLAQANDVPSVDVESVMSIAFELARIREKHGAQSDVYLSEVRALRAEVERLAAQAAPTEQWVNVRECGWHHYTPQNIDAMIRDLKAVEQGNEIPEWVNRDHRTRCGILWRVISALSHDVPLNPDPVTADDGFAQAPVQPQAVVPAPNRTPGFDASTPTGRPSRDWYAAKIHETLDDDFTIGPNAAAQPSAQAERAPVVQAVQAGEYPPLPEGVKARFKCEDCDGTGYTGEMIPGSEFQPPEPVGCTSCRFTGWWAECEAYSADQMRAYVDADRASSGAAPAAQEATTLQAHTKAVGEWLGELYAVMVDPCADGRMTPQAVCDAIMAAALQARELAATTQAVRMLTKEELTDLIAQHLSGTYHCLRVWEAWHVGTMSADDFQGVGESDTPAELADAIIAAGRTIPADGKIGDAA